MIFRFCSGSVTPARRSRNSADASTNTSGSCSRSNRLRICAASFSRSTPLSTKMHVSRSPIARCRISAATVESTPPLSAQTTRPVAHLRPDARRRLLHERRHRPVAGAAADAVGEVAEDVEAALRVHDLGMKQQRVERVASGSAIAATGAFALVATTDEAGRGRGDEVAVARPHAQLGRHVGEERTRSAADRVRRSCFDRSLTVAWPNSRCGAGATAPPSASRHELHAVADAEHRAAELEQPPDRTSARPDPTRSSVRPRG